MHGTLRLGVCQTPEFLVDVRAAMDCIRAFAQEADAADVDLLLFPECFLQGYLPSDSHVPQQAMDLQGDEFGQVRRELESIRQLLVIGVIEQRGRWYYNSAVVLAHGAILGVYRKTHLVAGESIFEAGDAYPTFEHNGVRFGINICFDTQFPAAASAVAQQGARLLLVPAQNMMRRDAAERWKDRHHAIRADRVHETGMWLASADVTGERGEHHIAYGPTSIFSPSGDVLAEVPRETTGMAVADISPSADA